jgi:hypothetical protein
VLVYLRLFYSFVTLSRKKAFFPPTVSNARNFKENNTKFCWGRFILKCYKVCGKKPIISFMQSDPGTNCTSVSNSFLNFSFQLCKYFLYAFQCWWNKSLNPHTHILCVQCVFQRLDSYTIVALHCLLLSLPPLTLRIGI